MARPKDGVFAFNLIVRKRSLLPVRHTVRTRAMGPEVVQLFDQTEKLLEVGGDARGLVLRRLHRQWLLGPVH